MCGIVSVLTLSGNYASQIALERLKRLEYRGYDSFGYMDESFQPQKYIGAISKVSVQIDSAQRKSIAISHTRWATHGSVNTKNTHPHMSNSKMFALVHNGVVANFRDLKSDLCAKGFEFFTETDSEVLVNLIEFEHLQNPGKRPQDVIRQALSNVKGEYAIVVMSKAWPNTLVCVKNGSPLVVSASVNMGIAASDENALASDFKDCVHMVDGEILILQRHAHMVCMESFFLDSAKTCRDYRDRFSQIAPRGSHELGAQFPDFMSKEMAEIPEAITRTPSQELRDCVPPEDRLLMIGCGSAYYVACIGQYMRLQMNPHVLTLAYASDEVFDAVHIPSFDSVLGISQSGETYDTLEPLKRASQKTLCITNVRGSTMSKLTDIAIFQDSGPERCVLSTKSVIHQCTIMYQMFSNEPYTATLENLKRLSSAWRNAFYESSITSQIKDIALKCRDIDNFFFIGRSTLLPVAMENALKLKEVTYCHAEGMGAGFFKHGTLSLVDSRFVTFAHLPEPSSEDQFLLTDANISEIESRGGVVFRVGHSEECDIRLPDVHPSLNALLHLGFGQHLAYTLAKILNRDVDQPRHLAKSVTVR